MKRLSSRGDTLVEVLIAMVLVSAVLGTAFVTVNKSLSAERAAEERSEALQLLQSQAEDLRIIAPSALQTQAGRSGSAAYFCISSQTIQGGFSAIPAAAASSDNFSEYPASCTKNTTQPIYYFSIVSTGQDAVDNTHIFLLRARWHSIDNGGNDQVILEYKI